MQRRRKRKDGDEKEINKEETTIKDEDTGKREEIKDLKTMLTCPTWSDEDSVVISPILSVERREQALTALRNGTPHTSSQTPVLLESSLFYYDQKAQYKEIKKTEQTPKQYELKQDTFKENKYDNETPKDITETEPLNVEDEDDVQPKLRSILKTCGNKITKCSSNPAERETSELTNITEVRSTLKLRKIRFSDVGLFYFSRTQGWLGVPKEGGNTLGKAGFMRVHLTCFMRLKSTKLQFMLQIYSVS